MGVGGLIVAEESRYRERRESPGLFAAIPSLLRHVIKDIIGPLFCNLVSYKLKLQWKVAPRQKALVAR